MNLKNYLEKLDPKQIVAIGASNGDSFVYIGEAGNVSLIDKVFKDYLRRSKAMLTRSNKELVKLCYSVPAKGKNENETLKHVLDYAEKVARTRSSMMINTRYIETYEPVLERRVNKHYEKEIDSCIAIMIKGTEKGEFWLKEEFDKKYGN